MKKSFIILVNTLLLGLMISCGGGDSDANYNMAGSPFVFKGGNTSFSICDKEASTLRSSLDVDKQISEICKKDNLREVIQIDLDYDESYSIYDLVNPELYPFTENDIVDAGPWDNGAVGKTVGFTWNDYNISICVMDSTPDPYGRGWKTEVLLILENWDGGDISIKNIFDNPKYVEARLCIGNPVHAQCSGQTGWTKDSRELRKKLTSYVNGEIYDGSESLHYFKVLEDGSEGIAYLLRLRQPSTAPYWYSGKDYFDDIESIVFTLGTSSHFEWLEGQTPNSIHANWSGSTKHTYLPDEYSKVNDETNTVSE